MDRQTKGPTWGYLALLGFVLTLFASIINFNLAEGAVARFLRGFISQYGYSGVTNTDMGVFLTNLIFYPILMLVYLAGVLPIACYWRPDWLRNPVALLVGMALPVGGIALLWLATGELFWIYTLPAVLCCAVAVGLELFLARKETPG